VSGGIYYIDAVTVRCRKRAEWSQAGQLGVRRYPCHPAKPRRALGQPGAVMGIFQPFDVAEGKAGDRRKYLNFNVILMNDEG
jgi:hypothetical protein